MKMLKEMVCESIFYLSLHSPSTLESMDLTCIWGSHIVYTCAKVSMMTNGVLDVNQASKITNVPGQSATTNRLMTLSWWTFLWTQRTGKNATNAQIKPLGYEIEISIIALSMSLFHDVSKTSTNFPKKHR